MKKVSRILIVDDDVDILGFLEAAAASNGLSVATAASGQEAAEKAAEQPPDVIVTDLTMPGQGGYEFLRSLQSSEAKRIPVIIISARKLDASTIELLGQEANVTAFLPKPVSLPDFLAAIYNALEDS